MPRTSAQSDFVFAAPVVEQVVELPPGAEPVKLPRAIWRTPFASARATRWVLGITFFMLAALAILLAVGPHIPSGE